MADIQAPPVTRGNKPRAKKHAFHLDMTPMVDLAFLLLTFFMLTTTFAKSTVMEVMMPVKDLVNSHSEVSDKKALTLILGENNQVHYFFGLNEAGSRLGVSTKLHTTNYSSTGLRQVLLARQQRQPAPIVLIKTGPGSSYQNMVDALDEMNITDQKKYVLTDLDSADKQLLASKNL